MTERPQVVTLVCVRNSQEESRGLASLWLVPGREPPLGYYDVIAREGIRIVGPTSADILSQVVAGLDRALGDLGFRVLTDETADI